MHETVGETWDCYYFDYNTGKCFYHGEQCQRICKHAKPMFIPPITQRIKKKIFKK